MIEFHLDGRSRVSTYMQLVQQVRQALRVGMLEPGDQLPRVREVAESLAINPNTVLKAYRELEHDGLVEGRPGQGTFVLRSLAGPSLGSQVELRQELPGVHVSTVLPGVVATPFGNNARHGGADNLYVLQTGLTGAGPGAQAADYGRTAPGPFGSTGLEAIRGVLPGRAIAGADRA